MEYKEIERLKNIYKSYGFNLEREYKDDEVLVFRLKSGYFDNADIISISTNSDPARAFKDFSDIGYACSKRYHATADDAESELFRGFFAVEATQNRLRTDYLKYQKSIVERYNTEAKYEYINAPYTINHKAGTSTPWKEVLERLDDDRPTLFLIEAAAGFGKTCTAWEIVEKLLNSPDYIPLFSELARYRQARIFRHILLEEIDHTFPTLNSRLVQSEIRSGRVITVLDGFDELLRDKEDPSEPSNHEPMLETIGEFLSGRAKIVLTTRRTVLFEGDDFHQWISENQERFDLVRIKISEPEVSDWLSERRLDEIKKSGIDPENIANPVMLALLRYVSEVEFNKMINNPEKIVDQYFERMMTREKTRQDLRIEPQDQSVILQSIAADMTNLKYTAEERDYLIDFILAHHLPLIEHATKMYASNERPSREEIANKLATHALLDRTAGAKEQVCFVNEFVLGHFVARNIIESIEWLNDDMRFLEPAALSYQPRPKEQKRKLWNKINLSSEFLEYTERVYLSAILNGSIEFNLSEGEVSSLEIDRTNFRLQIDSFQFNNCTFKDCSFDASQISDVTFLHCRFYGCTWANSPRGALHVLGCDGDSAPLEFKSSPDDSASIEDKSEEARRYVLEKYWPIGKEQVAYKTRPTKVLYGKVSNFPMDELFDAVESLKQEGLLKTPKTQDFVDINFDRLNEIREILKRS